MARLLLYSDVIIWCLRDRVDVLVRVGEFVRIAAPACSSLAETPRKVGTREESTPAHCVVS
ncbi:MAG: hypothetical protein HYY93_10190 [Planctomycetes bacterium]|nr:hypothetical protein [Planctomycetota bacterium]